METDNLSGMRSLVLEDTSFRKHHVDRSHSDVYHVRTQERNMEMKADRRKIEIIMARTGKRRKDFNMTSSTVQNIIREKEVLPDTIGRLARELGVDITEILKEEEDAK